jgi:hypothetical protein
VGPWNRKAGEDDDGKGVENNLQDRSFREI